ncbi:MAG: AVAST type 1 anti-phage system protease Avs1b [Gammaproteobacteria bacterium]|jgi:Trypsin.
MLDSEIRLSTCRIECGTDSDTNAGTGWLVSPDMVMTALHCVADAIDGSAPITLTFNSQEASGGLKANIIDHDEELDVCLLSIERTSEVAPIPMSEAPAVGGSQFYSYGWPVSKLTIGHRLEGTISQVLETPKLGIDVEIHIDSSAALSNYQGLSGAALICDGACLGIIRVSMDNTIGAISIARMGEFLRKHGIIPEDMPGENPRTHELASREDFTLEFDTFVTGRSGGYIFIEGAHGIGKSTFCETYKPVDPSLEYFDTYSFTSNRDAVNVVQLAQPQEFLNWLNMQVSMFITQEPGRIVKKDYPDLIKEVERLLVRLGEEYTTRGKIGVLFIDGVDELEKSGGGMSDQFIGLLPQQVPAGLALVLSAPSYVRLAAQLGVRLGNDACLSIPLLTHNATRNFCRHALIEERSTPLTIKLICDKAQGHPLYLRYLIDLANSGTDDAGLTALPLIEGSIRNYYEALWNQLQGDAEAVNLLAIIARLRWGIPIQQFTEVLNQAEQVVLVSTIARIQHLLLDASETTIYHSSFSDFLTEKTQLRELDIQIRLADYCENNRNNRYGLLNFIHHGLKSEDTRKAHVIALCDQKWVDDSVSEGGKPDVLLNDVDKVLAAATELGSLVETVRILLLSQRLQFRYNTLFAQSADLTANALISLGKTQETLQHVIRYGRLIIPIPEALRTALQLVEACDHNNALKLLNIIETELDVQLELASSDVGISIPNFLGLYDLQLQQFLLKCRANDKNASNELQRFQFFWMQAIDACSPDEESSRLTRSEMMRCTLAAGMCLSGRYTSISMIRQHYSGPTNQLVEPLINTAYYYRELCSFYSVNLDQSILGHVFDDLQLLVSDGWDDSNKTHPSIVDNLISLGARSTVISVISGEQTKAPLPIQFVAEDNVSMDESLLHEGMAEWRFESLITPDLPCPALTTLSPSDWRKGIESICKITAWCDGAGRRISESNDTAGLKAVWSELERNVFDQLRFTLAQRVEWEDSYALPEAVFPYIYQRLAVLVTDIFPGHLDFLLSFIEGQFTLQCGLYSEGFRGVLAKVLDKVTSKPLDAEVEDQAFTLIVNWRKFVQANLNNRHELVPELLTITPLFVRLNASEEAQRTYQSVLAFSMGPSWYKEDQFGLMITALESLSNSSPIESGVLPKIAGLLDEAGGEMTFQRFVRYAKRDLIGALCERGDFVGAVSYFIRQTYGTSKQLYEEATQGNIDRVSLLRGARFPGGALDEQDSICRIVKPAILVADWPLCWTLLEIFQFGDSRHLDNYAEAYALLIQQAQEDSSVTALMFKRLKLICESEVEKTQRSSFISSVRRHFPSELIGQFEKLFGILSKLPNTTEVKPNQVSVDSSNYGKEGQPEENEARDALYMPGTFGTTDSIQEAEKAFSKAERHLRRGNNYDAQKEAIVGLEGIQNGGWPIWFNKMEGVSEAEQILLKSTESASELVKLYTPVILNEHHAARWQIANHMIGWIADRASHDEKAALVRLAIEHTETMVGSTDDKIQSFEFLEEVKEADASSSLIQLILHALDHPTWLRREKAAEMVLWLLRNHSKYIPMLGAKAFSMDSNNHPDVLCGVFDQLSSSDSERLWDQLAPALDFNSIKQDCKHVGRLSVLIRIASRAAQRGSDSASQVLTEMKKSIPATVEVADVSRETEIKCPSWAEVCRFQWSRLKEKGLITPELVERATAVIKEQCFPLSLETNLEMEQLLTEGVSTNSRGPGRWEAKVRFAFQVALLPVMSRPQLPQIEDVFRPYNPSRLDNLRITGFSSPAVSWLAQLKSASGTIRPISGRNIYLDFYERIWFEDSWRNFRLTAYFFESDKKPSFTSGRFLSTEEPTLRDISHCDTCAKVEALPAYFGSFSPAIPTPILMQMTRAGNSDLTRAYWRSGRLAESLGGGPEHEGCYLAIDTDVLQLPAGFKLAWVCELDEKPIGMITL